MLFTKAVRNSFVFAGLTGIITINTELVAHPEESNFSISPLVNVLDLRSGQAKGVISVSNKGKTPLRMRAYPDNFTYERSKGFTTIGDHPQSAVKYIQFAPRELVVPPGVTRNIRVGTTIPSNLPDGEYRVVIYVQDLNEQKVTNSQGQIVKIQTRISCLYFFNKGATKSEISISSPTWQQSSKDLHMVLSNKGKKTSYPKVSWRLEKDGKVFTESSNVNILLQSQSEREIPLDLDTKKVGSGNYAFVGSIKEPGQNLVPFNFKVVIP